MRWLLLLLVIGCATGQAVGTGEDASGVDVQSMLCNSPHVGCQPWIESVRFDYVLTGAPIQGFDNSVFISTTDNYNTTTIRSTNGIFSVVDENVVPLTGENETNITLCVQPNWISAEDILVTFLSPGGGTATTVTAAVTYTPTLQQRTVTTGSEVCNDDRDNDGDSEVDCDDSDCSNSVYCIGPGVSLGGGSTGVSVGSGSSVNIDAGTGIVIDDEWGEIGGSLDPDGSSTTITHETVDPGYDGDCNDVWFMHNHSDGNGQYTVTVTNPEGSDLVYTLDFNVTVPENYCFDSADNDGDGLTDCHDTVCADDCHDAYSDRSVYINLTLVNQTSTNFTVEVGVNTGGDFDYVNVSTKVVENSTGILSNEFYGCLGINTVNVVNYETWCRADSVVSWNAYTPLYNMTYNFTDTQHNITVNQSTVSVHGYDLTVNVEEMIVVQESSCYDLPFGDMDGDLDIDSNDYAIMVDVLAINSFSDGHVGEEPLVTSSGRYVCETGENSDYDSGVGDSYACGTNSCLLGDMDGDLDIDSNDYAIMVDVLAINSFSDGHVGEEPLVTSSGRYVCETGENSDYDSSLNGGSVCQGI